MKRLFLFILLCVFVWGMKAQEMDAVFVAMPDQYVPQLENAWRKDLIDLYNSGKEAKLKNTMNGFSTLKKLTDDYLLLQVTDRSTVEMKLLPLVNNTYVVCMITTVYGPVPDDRLETVGCCRFVYPGFGRMVYQRRCRQKPHCLYRSNHPFGYGLAEVFAQP